MKKRIPLDAIEPNPDQPRRAFCAADLRELAASIRERGLIQAIIVRPVEGRARPFEIVAGERRWRAHHLLRDDGHLPDETILCEVRAMDKRQRDLEAIIENLARVDVKPIEEARAFQRLLDQGMTVDELARALGISQPRRIRDRLHLLRLSPEIQVLAEAGQLSPSAAYEIARLEPGDQMRVVRLVSAGKLITFSAVAAAVQGILQRETQPDLLGGAPAASDAEVRTISVMEARIEKAGRLVATGWKDGECVVARRVSPDRADRMADQLAGMQKALRIMERDLRAAAAQAALAVDAAE